MLYAKSQFPQSGIEPMPPVLEAWIFNPWTAREFPHPTPHPTPFFYILVSLGTLILSQRWFYRLTPICLEWFIVAQSLCRVQLSVTPWTAACQASLSITIPQSWSGLGGVFS